MKLPIATLPPTPTFTPATRATTRVREMRFREAIPEYRRVLRESGRNLLEPSGENALVRWGERWPFRFLASIRPDEIQAYFFERLRAGTPQCDVERERCLLQKLYRWAGRAGVSSVDPMHTVSAVCGLPTAAPVIWTAEEQEKLLDVCSRRHARDLSCDTSSVPPAYLHPVVHLCIKGGLRLNHVLTLEWRQINFALDRILIPCEITKTGREIDIPLTPELRCFLEKLRSSAADAFCKLPARVFDAAGLPLWKGEPDEPAVVEEVRKACRAAGVREPGGDCLRLTFAWNCARSGVQISLPLRVSHWEDRRPVEKVYEENGRRPV